MSQDEVDTTLKLVRALIEEQTHTLKEESRQAQSKTPVWIKWTFGAIASILIPLAGVILTTAIQAGEVVAEVKHNTARIQGTENRHVIMQDKMGNVQKLLASHDGKLDLILWELRNRPERKGQQ